MEGISKQGENRKVNIATVFSGIGAFEQCLNKLGVGYNVVFACDNGERTLTKTYDEIIDYGKENNFSNEELNEYVKSLYLETKKPNMMKESYFANYDITEDRWYEDIRFIDGKKYKKKVDIFVGGSPCQSFSIIGKKAGLEDARGTLFYEYARLVKEMQPKAFIYENVQGMLTHDKGNTWKVIKEVFESLNYEIKFDILNSKDYGIPQDRKRLFVVGIRNRNKQFNFPEKINLESTMFDFLEEKVDTKFYLGKKGFEFVTNPKYRNRARVNREIIQTQKANQQFNWNGDFVFEKLDYKKHNEDILNRAYVGIYNGEKGVIRQLTNRECMRLMGFPDSYNFVVPGVWAYRQAGNSIVVNVLEAITKEILNTFEDNRVRVATVFSGIGAIEYALKRMNVPHEIVFACDNGERDIEYNEEEEKDNIKQLNGPLEKREYVDRLYASKTSSKNYVEESYLANYPEFDPNYYFQDVKLLDGNDFRGKVDLFVGGSPCQSFSSVGEQKGLDDARGTLFYEYARLVKEIQPRVFIYENVRNVVNHDKGKTWATIKAIFNELGYKIDYSVLNACNYGIPQNRRRLFVVGFKEDVDFEMPPGTVDLKYVMKDFTINNCSEGNFISDQNGNIVVNKQTGIVDNKYYLTPKLYNYVMRGGTKTFYQKPEINKDIARTILKTMGNRHRAGVDNYVSFDGTEDLGSVRMLTEREALRLMGYTDDFKIVVSRAQVYKQAGNSIVVDVMMAVLRSIIETGVFD